MIPKTFPMIGEFGGVEQKGNGHDKLEIDSKYNVRYIAADPGLERDTSSTGWTSPTTQGAPP